jgi:hypothetical protein
MYIFLNAPQIKHKATSCDWLLLAISYQLTRHTHPHGLAD